MRSNIVIAHLVAAAVGALTLMSMRASADEPSAPSEVLFDPVAFALAEDEPAGKEDQPAESEGDQEQTGTDKSQEKEKTISRFSRAPAMFGDLFGVAGGRVSLSLDPQIFEQNWADGDPFDTFVTNPIVGPPAFGIGADPSGAVPITVTDQGTNQVLATSISVGIDVSGDGQPDTYQISEPLNSAPMAPGPGTITYLGGNAVFTGVPAMPGVNPATQAANGSVGVGDNWNLIFAHQFTPDANAASIFVPTGGDMAVRRIKISENNSPQPRDRVIFNYNFLNDVITGIGDVNRYTFGIEKTFYDGKASLEILLPVASTLGNDQFVDRPGGRFTEFGNMTAIWKHVLYQNECTLASGGLGFTVPTAQDSKLFLNGAQILRISSRSVRLLPFLALLRDHGQRVFWQSMLQLDIDVNGNPVFGDIAGANLDRIGVLQDPTLLFMDCSLGYWLYERDCEHGISGIATMAELHYSTTLQDSDAAAGNGLSVGSVSQRYDALNLTVGAAFVWSDWAAIRPAMVIPLQGGDDRQFDYQAMVQMNLKY